VFSDLPNSIATEGAASGNVIAYNYFRNPRYINGQTDINSYTLVPHGGGTWMNLFEGNIVEKSKFRQDSGFGSQHNSVVFRNKVSCDTSTVTGREPIDIEYGNYWNNVVGNVLGDGTETQFECHKAGTNCDADTRSIYRTGYDTLYDNNLSDTSVRSTMLRHANYDYVNDAALKCDNALEPGCQGVDSSQYDDYPATDSIPNSLYLTSKPSWFGSLTWPPIDPVGPTVGNIPAKYFYENEEWPSESTPPSKVMGVPGSGVGSYMGVPVGDINWP
jgi:hypothetical protein